MTERPRSIASGRARVAIVACAAIVTLAIALLLLLAGRQAAQDSKTASERPPVVLPAIPALSSRTSGSEQRKRIAGQDPQERRGTHAWKAATRAASKDRALQHVPYRHDGVTITLTGALPGGRAILTVTAGSLRAARAGYRRFLARFDDTGRSYRPRFRVGGHRHG